MADEPLIPQLMTEVEISDTEIPASPVPPLEMERPIRTDVILEDDEVLAEAPENGAIIPEGMDIEVDEELDEEGNTVVSFGEEMPEPLSEDFYKNLAEEIDQRELGRLASELLGMYSEDRESRSDWERTYSEGLGLLGMDTDDRSEPFQGASGVYHPLLSEAVAQFQSSAYKELLPSGGPVSTRVVGRVTPERQEQANRVKEFMNYQITEVMQEYDPELDQMLFYLPLSGSSFKKIYYDEGIGRAVSKFITSEDLVVPYETTDLQSANRITHMIRQNTNDVRKLQASGFYRDIELRPPDEPQTAVTEQVDEREGGRPTHYSSGEVMTILECHINLDLPGFEDFNEEGEPTGIQLPYIVTMEEGCSEILSIRRNWDETDPLKSKKDYFVHYKFLPGLGFYGFGLIHMIGGLSKSATSLLRQLIVVCEFEMMTNRCNLENGEMLMLLEGHFVIHSCRYPIKSLPEHF